MPPVTHRWKFARTGGVDLKHLDELDEKLWVALAMPCVGVQLDPKTLAALDTDKDGRVRAPEVREAVRFACAAVKNPDDLLKGGEDSIALDALADGPIKASAARILANLGKPGETRISLADVADTARIFANTRFNGDGIVPADAAEDDPTRKILEEIMQAHGSVPDRSGKPGVDQKRVDAFFDEVKAYVAWAAEALGGGDRRPLGDGSPAA